MNRKIGLAAVTLGAAWALIAPMPAHAVTASITGATAYDWSYGHRVTICDSAGDNRAVMSEYVTNNYHYSNVKEFGGWGNCEDSSYESSLIDRLNACRSGWGGIGWSCGYYVYTGY